MKRYGWKKDKADARDFRMVRSMAALPSKVDLRDSDPPVYDQGNLGSCTANAIAALYQASELKQNELPVMPSRLFIYYNERDIEGSVSEDSGAEIRDGFKTIGAQGVCPEDQWPYLIAQFRKKPPESCYQSAKGFKAMEYRRLDQDLNQLKASLAAGYRFAFGFSVFESFEGEAVATTGMATLPVPGEKCLGGHAVAAVGYDDTLQCFLVRNSWGPGWGLAGYFYLPYAYITDPELASDFWAINRVE